MAQVVAIQATVAQMNLSKRRNIGVPFPRAVTPDRSVRNQNPTAKSILRAG